MANQNGNSDTYFIAEVRRILRDQPVLYGESQPTDGTTGALTPGSKPFRLSRAPVVKDGAFFKIQAPGGPWTPTFDNYSPTGTNVGVISDTGEVIFPSAPAVGTMAVTYQAFRYSDQQITDALYDGLRLLWPDIWNWSTDTTSILVSPTQYEYPLPAVFQDNRVVLRTVEYAPPSGIIRYFSTSLWRQVEDPQNPLLVFSRIPPVASQVRLGYVQPLQTLAQTPSQAQNIPVYFAIARLIIDQDTMRNRSDDLPAQTAEGAVPAGAVIGTADYWMQQFSQQLQRLSLDEPARRSIQHRAVERLGLSSFWTDVA